MAKKAAKPALHDLPEVITVPYDIVLPPGVKTNINATMNPDASGSGELAWWMSEDACAAYAKMFDSSAPNYVMNALSAVAQLADALMRTGDEKLVASVMGAIEFDAYAQTDFLTRTAKHDKKPKQPTNSKTKKAAKKSSVKPKKP